ncbi:MAG: inositol monophosphatase family protein [Planctomycetota bacterium]|jgi:histidinol-phosphatase
MSPPETIVRAVDVAREAVEAGGARALAWWKQAPPTTEKSDGSPVSKADRESEAAILEVVRGAFPDHDVLSEESGAIGSGLSDWRWICDPLDGTLGFLRGDRTWGPLLALEHRGLIVAGAMHMPVQGDTWWARRGGGCFRNHERIHVSDVDDFERATLAVGFIRGLLAEPHGENALELICQAKRVRCPGDLAGCAMVLEGRADVWLEAGVHEWDLAAGRILVEEAGGRFSDFNGAASHCMGTAIGSNRRLHDHVLRVLRS